ncbi:hypothetical protein ACIJDS_001158 [Enterococcus faecalis]|uniref:hypothetical protein n=1 Tax=Enterococcus faecalis TaxID=1351 RepID=UPI000CF2F6A4|nr:hypothetical protein [Enterococcus faecalis]EGO8814472.1 hypothetical protein [Enterococcus faecalis]MCU2219660.1 hypothetical protein [Enterococcus faecalis]MCU2255246.1 hypothetical protein [Enterococcus faecalis]MDT2189182.1 hypothetical protein [Enterococcus faecalis]MEB7970027.1 hypothetical protein [Enterococcus faecalis]
MTRRKSRKHLRSCCFCSRRLSVFERGTKIQSDFCSTLLLISGLCHLVVEYLLAFLPLLQSYRTKNL